MPDNIKENTNNQGAGAPSGNGQSNKKHHHNHNHNHGKNRPPRERGAETGAVDTDAALAEAKARIRAEAAGAEINQHPSQPQKPREDRRPQNQNRQGQNASQNNRRDNQQNGRDGNRQNDRGDRNRRDRNRGRDRRQDRNPAADATAQENELLRDSLAPLSSSDGFGESFLQSRDELNFGISKIDDAILDAMPPDPTLDAVFGEQAPAPEPVRDGTEIVGIHFPQGGKVYYFDPAGNKFEKGSFAIVETARGQELGEVAIANCTVANEDIVQPLKPVIRPASKEDLEHHELNLRREKDASIICRQKIEAHKLDMKLTGTQYTFDNAKLIFYFTAAQRVDFRELVKDLATTFHTRIELRQIGSRDEAKMIGGHGACGRSLCCSGFLPNYAQVSIKMAKHQGLAMNSAKLSGICGRLMCCLRFEESTYERELALMPTPNSIVDTPDGRGRVTDVRPVGYTVKVKLDGKDDAPPKVYKLADVKTVVRAAEIRDDEGDNSADDN